MRGYGSKADTHPELPYPHVRQMDESGSRSPLHPHLRSRTAPKQPDVVRALTKKIVRLKFVT